MGSLSFILAEVTSKVNPFAIPITILVIAIIVLVIIIIVRQNNFKKKYYSDLVKREIPSATFDVKGFLPQEKYEEIGLRVGNRYKGSDYLVAKTDRGNNFLYSEIDNVQHYYSDDVKDVIYFRGGIFIADMPKKFNDPVFLFSRAFDMVNLSGHMVKFKPFFDKSNNVETENVEFNKAFKIKAKNTEDVFYLLTPTLIERLLKVKKRFERNNIVIVFYDNKVAVLLSGLDLFKAPALSHKKEAVEKYVSKAVEDIKLIMDFVDLFHIDDISAEDKQYLS